MSISRSGMGACMKIAVFTDTFYPQVNGVVNAIRNYDKMLTGLGHTVTVFTSGKIPSVSELDGAEVRRYRAFTFLPYPEFEYSVDVIHPVTAAVRFKPNIVHAHTPFLMGYCAWMTARTAAAAAGGDVPHAHRRVRDVRGEELEAEPADAEADREVLPGLVLQPVRRHHRAGPGGGALPGSKGQADHPRVQRHRPGALRPRRAGGDPGTVRAGRRAGHPARRPAELREAHRRRDRRHAARAGEGARREAHDRRERPGDEVPRKTGRSTSAWRRAWSSPAT